GNGEVRLKRAEQVADEPVQDQPGGCSQEEHQVHEWHERHRAHHRLLLWVITRQGRHALTDERGDGHDDQQQPRNADAANVSQDVRLARLGSHRKWLLNATSCNCGVSTCWTSSKPGSNVTVAIAESALVPEASTQTSTVYGCPTTSGVLRSKVPSGKRCPARRNTDALPEGVLGGFGLPGATPGVSVSPC